VLLSITKKNLSQDVKDNINGLLGGLPEKLLNSQTQPTQTSQNQDQNREEVKIEEEPVPQSTQPETSTQSYEPLIQEISQDKTVVEEKIPQEIKKEYAPEVTEKAQRLKEIFEDIDLDNLLEFVSESPKLTLEELVENYLTL